VRGDSSRVVHTASRLQVKAPVNTKSVGRWRKYAAQLGESLLPHLRRELALLAVEGVLPFLGPDSPLLAQAQASDDEVTVKAGAEAGAERAGGEGQGQFRKEQFGKDQPLKQRRLAHETQGVFMNWALDEHFDYAAMLQQLRV
jgi:hypothetical protein